MLPEQVEDLGAALTADIAFTISEESLTAMMDAPEEARTARLKLLSRCEVACSLVLLFLCHFMSFSWLSHRRKRRSSRPSDLQPRLRPILGTDLQVNIIDFDFDLAGPKHQSIVKISEYR